MINTKMPPLNKKINKRNAADTNNPYGSSSYNRNSNLIGGSCCACSQGLPGIRGLSGKDGLPGKAGLAGPNGRPGKNGNSYN